MALTACQSQDFCCCIFCFDILETINEKYVIRTHYQLIYSALVLPLDIGICTPHVCHCLRATYIFIIYNDCRHGDYLSAIKAVVYDIGASTS